MPNSLDRQLHGGYAEKRLRWAKALLRSVSTARDARHRTRQSRLSRRRTDHRARPAVTDALEQSRADLLAFTAFTKEV